MNSFINGLSKCLQQPLPSCKAHNEMIPASRGKNAIDPGDIIKAGKSSVLILFYPKQDNIYTVFIKRPVYDGVHSGQVSFPGGKSEPEDKNLIDTALRESNEEIGVNQDNIIIIGNISDLYIFKSNYLVTPFIGVCKDEPVFILNKREVQNIIEVPLCDIIDKKNKSTADIKTNEGETYKVPCFMFNGNIIWGATAMILNEFVYLWKSINDQRC